MPTQKLILLLLLVATLGGSALWYLKTQLPGDLYDEFYSEGMKTVPDDATATSNESEAPVNPVPPAKTTTTNTVVAESGSAAAIAADLSAIDAAMDDSYDDTALSTEFNTADANTLTNSYDN